jgi:hypothetical protein
VFLVDRTYLRSNDSLHPINHEAGSIVDFDGTPGASMVALCVEGAEAKAAVARTRAPGSQKDCELIEARGRARLNNSQRQLLRDAQARLAK